MSEVVGLSKRVPTVAVETRVSQVVALRPNPYFCVAWQAGKGQAPGWREETKPGTGVN